jgi:hypothetical protein
VLLQIHNWLLPRLAARTISRAAIVLLIISVPLAFGQTESLQKDAAHGFIGGDACKTCHADVWSKFYKNPHFKSVASGKETPEHTGCEGCHGPAGAHVEAHGGKATIIAFSQLEPKKILDNCLR